MNKKLIIILVVLLAGGGFAAKTMLLKPKPVVMKVQGTVYVMPHQFTLNLADGRYATLTAALVLAPTQSDGATAEAGAASSDAEVGTLPEEAVIRDLITNILTGTDANTLISAGGRTMLKKKILTAIAKHTDDKITDILFPDLAVQ